MGSFPPAKPPTGVHGICTTNWEVGRHPHFTHGEMEAHGPGCGFQQLCSQRGHLGTETAAGWAGIRLAKTEDSSRSLKATEQPCH